MFKDIELLQVMLPKGYFQYDVLPHFLPKDRLISPHELNGANIKPVNKEILALSNYFPCKLWPSKFPKH